MSTPIEESALVGNLSTAMREKLALHSDDRESWRTYGDDQFYVDRVLVELAELQVAIEHGDSIEAVWREAADVANFAAMLADRHEQRMRRTGRQ